MKFQTAASLVSGLQLCLSLSAAELPALPPGAVPSGVLATDPADRSRERWENGLDFLLSGTNSAAMTQAIAAAAEVPVAASFFEEWRERGERPSRQLAASVADEIFRKLQARFTARTNQLSPDLSLADGANWALHEAVSDLRRNGVPSGFAPRGLPVKTGADYILAVVDSRSAALKGGVFLSRNDAKEIMDAATAGGLSALFPESSKFFKEWLDSGSPAGRIPSDFPALGYLLLGRGHLSDLSKARVAFYLYHGGEGGESNDKK